MASFLAGQRRDAEALPGRVHTLSAKAFGAQDFLLSDMFSRLEKRTRQTSPLANTALLVHKANHH